MSLTSDKLTRDEWWAYHWDLGFDELLGQFLPHAALQAEQGHGTGLVHSQIQGRLSILIDRVRISAKL
jgi:hypothetical protein